MEFNQYITNIERKLMRSFDIRRNCIINDVEYDMCAEYHLRNEKYVLVKTAVVYAFENNEYCLMKHFYLLDKYLCREYVEGLVRSVDMIVQPDANHMSSMITGIIVADEIPDSDCEEIIRYVKLFKFNKQFSFGFKGWADIRLVLVSLKGGVIATNRRAKQVSDVFDPMSV